MAEKKSKAAKPKKKSIYGQDSKGRYVILNGKKCYSQAEINEEAKKIKFN